MGSPTETLAAGFVGDEAGKGFYSHHQSAPKGMGELTEKLAGSATAVDPLPTEKESVIALVSYGFPSAQMMMHRPTGAHEKEDRALPAVAAVIMAATALQVPWVGRSGCWRVSPLMMQMVMQILQPLGGGGGGGDRTGGGGGGEMGGGGGGGEIEGGGGGEMGGGGGGEMGGGDGGEMGGGGGGEMGGGGGGEMGGGGGGEMGRGGGGLKRGGQAGKQKLRSQPQES